LGLSDRKGKEVEEKSVTAQTLVKSAYSIGTSWVTKDSDDESGKEKADGKANGGSDSKQVAIDGMNILHSIANTGQCFFQLHLWRKGARRPKRKGAQVRKPWILCWGRGVGQVQGERMAGCRQGGILSHGKN
jgi:hypothetical protein